MSSAGEVVCIAPYPKVRRCACQYPEVWRQSRAMKRPAASKGSKPNATGKERLGEPTLTASDWAEAALQLIAEQGLGALTVSALAARLGVTKGSFYWHF